MQHYEPWALCAFNQHTLSRDQRVLKQLVRFGPQLCAETKRPVEKKIKIREVRAHTLSMINKHVIVENGNLDML